MDNASKAIIMAGGILIAVAVIGVALYMFSNARELANASDEIMERSQIESFNRFYYAYAPLMEVPYSITGLDAYNIYKKAKNNNEGKEEGDYQYIDISNITSDTVDSFSNSENFLEKIFKVTIYSNSIGLIDEIEIIKVTT